jgi:hypothetical protein
MPVTTIENLSGRTYGNIQIGDISASMPRKYAVKCTKCGSSWNELHTTIQVRVSTNLDPECRNVACRKNVLNIAQNAKEFHIENARRKRTLAEAKALETNKLIFQQASKELAILEKERIKSGKDEFQVDDAVKNARMSQQDADRFNAESAAHFVDATPEYYPCPENHELLCEYLARNGCMIANQATWTKAFERLRDFGLLRDWPEPEPEPQPIPISMQHEQYPDPKPKTIQGWDARTGLEKVWSSREVDLMSSEELRVNFHIPRAASVRNERAN